MTKQKQKSRFKAPVYLAIFVFIIDFLSKWLVFKKIPLMSVDDLWYPYGGIGIFENFLGVEVSLVHALNKGAAWGIFSSYQKWLLVGRVVFITGFLSYALVFNKNRQYDLPFALIVSGAIGNIVDFFVYGHVVDMFHFVFGSYDYPVFNVADASICIGIFWLLFFTSQEDFKKGKK